MAYDLIVGKSSKVKDLPSVVGGIEFDEIPAIMRLLKRVDISLLHRLANFYEDAAFSVAEVEEALDRLLPLLSEKLQMDERLFLCKLISVLSYSKWKKLGLYGVAD